MQKFIQPLLILCLLSVVSVASAQIDSLPPQQEITDTYAKPELYEIGGIEVEGNRSTNSEAIINVTGLRIGQQLKVPGDQLPRAIKALWRLKLFTKVDISLVRKSGNLVFLAIELEERPRLARYAYVGARKGLHEDLNAKVSRFMMKGSIVTEDMKTNAANAIKAYFIDRGFLDVTTTVDEQRDSLFNNSVRLIFNIDKGAKVKIKSIAFEGNENVKDRKLRKVMKNTKTIKKPFSAAKLIEEEYEEDKQSIATYYNNIGHRDASIVQDSIWRVAKLPPLKWAKSLFASVPDEAPKPGRGSRLRIKMKVDEGKKYHFRNITFKGNSVYSTERLKEILGIEKGDVYDQSKLDQRINFSPDSRDIGALYMDNGYLFFRVDPIETSIDKDSVDIELRIFEGQQATIDKVVVTGNDRTHEHVIRRELRTRPGQKFSRSDIMRSQREIINLGYFNPEKLGIQTPVNPQRGTVDIEYEVEEKPSDQLELSAGWGGRNQGVIGTLGVTFNNFSLRNIFKPETWSPLPQGDGQRLSLRIQTTGRYLQSYNFSFTEPWLGGRKPNSFTLSGYYTIQTDGTPKESLNHRRLIFRGLNVGIGTRLKRPDDFFVSQTTLGLQAITLNNWGGFNFEGESLSKGTFNNFSIEQSFSRNSIDNPIFPTGGSRFVLTGKFTPPYSLFTPNRDFAGETLDKRFKFLEYHKWRFSAEWYMPLGKKFVIKYAAKLGMLGNYNSKIGTVPFERFQLGGDGLSANSSFLLGVDPISLRGYDIENIAANNKTQSLGNTTVFNKFTMEVRYPFSLNPNATIYGLGFVQGGNAWHSFRDYNPLDMYRSAGLGIRVFLPMFGTLGADYGIGFDRGGFPSGKLTDYGRLNIILGFEPE